MQERLATDAVPRNPANIGKYPPDRALDHLRAYPEVRQSQHDPIFEQDVAKPLIVHNKMFMRSA